MVSGGRLQSLHAWQFRNYADLSLAFNAPWTALLGHNGAGKTNFLEIIAMGVSSLPLRGSVRDVIQWEKEESGLRLSFASGHDHTLRFSHAGPVSRTPEREADASCPLPALVLFLPQEDALLDTTTGRRKLFGRGLFLLSQTYRDQSRLYMRLVRQRNALLGHLRRTREMRAAEELVSWTESLQAAMPPLWQERAEFFTYIVTHLPGILAELGGLSLPLTYELAYGGIGAQARPPRPEDIENTFREIQDEELRRGITLIGPHRDQFHVSIHGRPASTVLSRGQRRILLLALHVLEGRYSEYRHGQTALYLLDDILSELDVPHRMALRDTLASSQVILTSAEEHVLSALPPNSALYRVEAQSLHALAAPFPSPVAA